MPGIHGKWLSMVVWVSAQSARRTQGDLGTWGPGRHQVCPMAEVPRSAAAKRRDSPFRPWLVRSRHRHIRFRVLLPILPGERSEINAATAPAATTDIPCPIRIAYDFGRMSRDMANLALDLPVQRIAADKHIGSVVARTRTDEQEVLRSSPHHKRDSVGPPYVPWLGSVYTTFLSLQSTRLVLRYTLHDMVPTGRHAVGRVIHQPLPLVSA